MLQHVHTKGSRWTARGIIAVAESLGWKVLNESPSTKDRIEMVCPNGHVSSKVWYDFTRRQTCYLCDVARRRNSISKLKDDFSRCGYTWLDGEYKNAFSELALECPRGHEYVTKYNRWTDGDRCIHCYNEDRSKILRMSMVEVKSGLKTVGLKYVRGNFENGKSKIFVNCSKGHIFETCYNEVTNNSRCQECFRGSISKGEDAVRLELKRTLGKDVLVLQQKSFPDCRNKNALPFDFYIPDLNVLIEYQGEQHYKPISFFGGEKAFESRKNRDKIKAKYCRKNRIKLIVIPYWDYDNIGFILKKELF